MKKLTGEQSRWFSSSFSFRFLVGLLLGGGVVSVSAPPPPPRSNCQEASLQWFIIMIPVSVQCTAIALWLQSTPPYNNLVWDNIHVRSGVSSRSPRVAILSRTCSKDCMVCALLLATATTKQPPLVTKLSLTSSRHSDQSDLLISSTQDCSWACDVYLSGRALFSVAEFACAIAHACSLNAIVTQRQPAILVPDSPPWTSNTTTGTKVKDTIHGRRMQSLQRLVTIHQWGFKT